MSECRMCVNFWSDWNTCVEACAHHGFYPGKPHTMPEKCRDYEYDERKDTGREKAPFPLLDEVSRLKCRLTKNYLVLVRIGDFYELFGEDATIAAPILGVSLTTRAGVPMCAVPAYAIDTNLAKLIREGKSVALAERRDDGKGAWFIHRIITPGTPQDVDGNGK